MIAIVSRLRGFAILKLLIGLGLLATLILWHDNGRKLVTLLAGFDERYIGLLFTIAILGRLARVVRWQFILRDGGIDVSLPRLFNLNLIGNFVSNFLPSMFGGDVAKSYLLGRQIGSQSRSAASVVFDRFAGFTAMIALALVYTAINPALAREPLVGTLIGLIALGAAIGLIVFLNARSLPMAKRLLEAVPASRRVTRPIAVLYDEIMAYRGRYRLFARALFHSVLYYMFATYGLYYGCLAIGINPSFFDVAVITPIAFLLMSVPVSPNNIGWWEWSMSLLLAQTGADLADGLAVALIMRAVATALSLLGGVLLMVEWLSRPRRMSD